LLIPSSASFFRPDSKCSQRPRNQCYGQNHAVRLFTFALQATQFIKLCRDCQVMGTTLSEANPPLSEADVQVTFTAEVKKADKTNQKMHYNDFLTALMKISVKVYPTSRTVDEAFQVCWRFKVASSQHLLFRHPGPSLLPRYSACSWRMSSRWHQGAALIRWVEHGPARDSLYCVQTRSRG
jgi:hypothetical protein